MSITYARVSAAAVGKGSDTADGARCHGGIEVAASVGVPIALVQASTLTDASVPGSTTATAKRSLPSSDSAGVVVEGE